MLSVPRWLTSGLIVVIALDNCADRKRPSEACGEAPSAAWPRSGNNCTETIRRTLGGASMRA